ncbi:MAG: serine hydrolase [Clostridia bacterium]|nr:serine hydrolase [Clostridia bacterium]
MFETCSPEAMNVDSAGIVRFLDEMKEKHLHMHAMMILRRGKVIFETSFAPWSKDKKHMLFSLSKSFTSTAVGFAVQDGLLKTADRLVDFFPELLTNKPCENMQKITVKNLLTMNTGHKAEPARMGNEWEKDFVRSYIEFEPGTHFMYNTYGTFMLSAIVQKVTGKKLVEYLKEKLFIPLGMSEDIWSEESPSGVATGGYGLNVRIADIAKLGQFYLQGGVWEGKQLLNAEWIRDAQTPWSDNSISGGDGDCGQGYGYQFWMCKPEGVFRGDGAFGQYCIVCPKQEMVIAINSGVSDMGAVMRSIWNNILPGVDHAGENGQAALTERARHTVTPAYWEDNAEDASAPAPEKGWIGRYRMNKDNPLQLELFELDEANAYLTLQGVRNAVPLCLDTWQHVKLEPDGDNDKNYMNETAVRAARVGDQLVLHFCHTKTPFEDVLRISFSEHGLHMDGRRNVGFGEGKYELLGYRL